MNYAKKLFPNVAWIVACAQLCILLPPWQIFLKWSVNWNAEYHDEIKCFRKIRPIISLPLDIIHYVRYWYFLFCLLHQTQVLFVRIFCFNCMHAKCIFSYVKKTYLKSNFLHVLLFRVAQYFVFLAVFYCFLCSTKKCIDIENIEKSIFVLFMNYFHFSLSGPKSMVVLSSALYIFRCIKSLLKLTKMWYRLLFGPLDWFYKLSKILKKLDKNHLGFMKH